MMQLLIASIFVLLCVVFHQKGDKAIRFVMQMLYEKLPNNKSFTYIPKNIDRTKLKF